MNFEVLSTVFGGKSDEGDGWKNDTATIKAEGEILTSNTPSHSSRRVFIFESFVIKFASRFGGSDVQNRIERDFYSRLDNEDAEHFPKLLGTGEYEGKVFLVQERVVTGEFRADAHHEEKLNYLVNKYGLADMHIYEGNKKGHNVLIDDRGTLKIFDIGYNSDIINNEGVSP